jgi:hypothetical protein
MGQETALEDSEWCVVQGRKARVVENNVTGSFIQLGHSRIFPISCKNEQQQQ